MSISSTNRLVECQECHSLYHQVKTFVFHYNDIVVWRSSSALVSINEVNLHWARLALGWVTMSRFSFQCRTFILVSPATQANSAFHPSGVSKWGPALAEKEKAGMVHCISRWTRGVQVKLQDPLRMRAIPECLRGVFMMRRYINPRLPLSSPDNDGDNDDDDEIVYIWTCLKVVHSYHRLSSSSSSSSTNFIATQVVNKTSGPLCVTYHANVSATVTSSLHCRML